MPATIRLDHVTKSYGNHLATDDVSLEVRGEVEHVVGNPELLRHTPGVLDVGY